MHFLLRLSKAVDWLNDRVGMVTYWAILLSVLVSAGNATARYSLNIGSNAWLELQWYMFAAVFLLCAGYTLRHDEHIRIDVVSSHLSRRTQIWIDIFGTLFFMLPMTIFIMWLSWPVFLDAYRSNEVSTNAGGLLVWPARLMVPVGFLLLVLQGLSELVKRIAFLLGLIPDPNEKDEGPTDEELLAEQLRKERGETA